VDASSAIKIPTHIDAKTAVASFVQGMTAIYLSEDIAQGLGFKEIDALLTKIPTRLFLLDSWGM
jgi:NADPH:quinone reductase-like Zn-dependent oxidoreductase